jgi:hypothetical protein
MEKSCIFIQELFFKWYLGELRLHMVKWLNVLTCMFPVLVIMVEKFVYMSLKSVKWNEHVVWLGGKAF